MGPPHAFLERTKRGGGGPGLRGGVTHARPPRPAVPKNGRPPLSFLLPSPGGGGARGGRGGKPADPITHLAERMRSLPGASVPGLPRFIGGAVGFMGYDLVRSIERLSKGPEDTLGVPDAVVMIADSLVILDNVFGRAIVVANVDVPAKASPAQRLRLYDTAQERLDTLIGRLSGTHQLAPLALDVDGRALQPQP